MTRYLRACLTIAPVVIGGALLVGLILVLTAGR
jgi:hypothetical protein